MPVPVGFTDYLCLHIPFYLATKQHHRHTKERYIKWRPLLVAPQFQAHWYSFVLQLLSFSCCFLCIILWSTQEAKVLSYIKVIPKWIHRNLCGHSTSWSEIRLRPKVRIYEPGGKIYGST